MPSAFQLLPAATLAVSSFGWPLVVCGALKIVYDVTPLTMFRSVKPSEENAHSVKRENT